MGHAGRERVLQEFDLRINTAALARLFHPRSQVDAARGWC
jgi:hypothetical protein